MENIEIKDDEQLKSVLYLKDDLIHVYDAMRFAKGIDYNAFKKLDIRLQLLNTAIEVYIEKSDYCFQIKCLDNQVIEPQDKCELKTNVIGLHLNDTEVVFDGSIPSAGYLQLSYEDKDWGTNIIVKNNIPREALDNWDIAGYHYNNPLTTKYIAPGVYLIEKNTIIGVGCSPDKKLVKTIKNMNNSFR